MIKLPSKCVSYIIKPMKKVVVFSFILILFVLALPGCSSGNNELRQAVEKYNRAIVSLYRTANPDDIEEAATVNEQRRLGQILANMQDAGKLMQSNLDSSKFIEIKMPDKTENVATVKTEEQWSYRFFNQNSQPSGKFIKFNYEVTYSLVQQKTNNEKFSKTKKWLVDLVTITSEQKSEVK